MSRRTARPVGSRCDGVWRYAKDRVTTFFPSLNYSNNSIYGTLITAASSALQSSGGFVSIFAPFFNSSATALDDVVVSGVRIRDRRHAPPAWMMDTSSTQKMQRRIGADSAGPEPSFAVGQGPRVHGTEQLQFGPRLHKAQRSVQPLITT